MKFRKELGNILTAKTLYVLLPILGWSVQIELIFSESAAIEQEGFGFHVRSF